jgi:DNA invertase Pin-like site-specific DNA recombinase
MRLGAIAQFETEIRAERQRDGIEHAKARGVRFGRRKALPGQRIAEMQARRRQGTPIGTLMDDYRISKATVYRYLAQGSPDAAAAPDTVP